MTDKMVLCKLVTIDSDDHIVNLRQRNRLYWRGATCRFSLIQTARAEIIRKYIEAGTVWLRTDGIY